MNDESPEQELWDDDAKATKKIFHKDCNGRVTWIKGEEHGCFKCGKIVPPEEMEFQEEEEDE